MPYEPEESHQSEVTLLASDPEIRESRPAPPRFGRENSQDFPDPDWAAGDRENTRDFAPIPIWPGSREIRESRFGRDRENSRDCASINRDRDRDRDTKDFTLRSILGLVQNAGYVYPLWTTSERNLDLALRMNSAGEEDEEQVDYGEENSSMSFNEQARSTRGGGFFARVAFSG